MYYFIWSICHHDLPVGTATRGSDLLDFFFWKGPQLLSAFGVLPLIYGTSGALKRRVRRGPTPYIFSSKKKIECNNLVGWVFGVRLGF